MTVVDRAARDIAAQMLRDFINGLLTNDDFSDDQPESSDPVIEAIWDTAWLFYSDTRTHTLTGGHRLGPCERRECARWILFLDSDLPYVWPWIPLPGVDPRRRIVGRGLRSGVFRLFGRSHPLTAANVHRFLSTGHYPVWPFRSVADYRAALASPRRLSGRVHAL